MDVLILLVYVIAAVAIVHWIGRTLWRHKWKILIATAVVLLVKNDEGLVVGLMKISPWIIVPGLITWILEGKRISGWFRRRKAAYEQSRGYDHYSIPQCLMTLWTGRALPDPNPSIP